MAATAMAYICQAVEIPSQGAKGQHILKGTKSLRPLFDPTHSLDKELGRLTPSKDSTSFASIAPTATRFKRAIILNMGPAKISRWRWEGTLMRCYVPGCLVEDPDWLLGERTTHYKWNNAELMHAKRTSHLRSTLNKQTLWFGSDSKRVGDASIRNCET